VRPELEDWVSCGALEVEGTPALFYYRFGRESGVQIYQGGIFVVEKIDFGNRQWGLDNLAVMIDSHAFKLPISRNDVIEDSALRQIYAHLMTGILPGIIGKICRHIGQVDVWRCDCTPECAANIVIGYLGIDPDFGPAQDLPLIPMLPFGLASINRIRNAHCRHGSLLLCKCGGDEFDGVTGHEIVIDEKRLNSHMEKFLENNFGPLKRVSYDDEAIEAPAGSGRAELTPLERRFQESLVLLSAGNELENTGAGEESYAETGTAVVRGLGWSDGNAGETNEYGPLQHPDLPDIRFKLTRLVRLDGKTPVSTIKFQIKGPTAILNLNHPEIQSHLAFAAKDPDLAAHWCLRELILSDRIECFKHLSYDACEALVLHDAIGRCVEVESGPSRRRPGNGSVGKNYWNDDHIDWEKLLGDESEE
jgi:hypothetical protein